MEKTMVNLIDEVGQSWPKEFTRKMGLQSNQQTRNDRKNVSTPNDGKKLAFGFTGIYIYVGVYVYNCIYIYTVFVFFARADLVRDLRPLALPCCSNYYGGAKSGEKRISLRKGEI